MSCGLPGSETMEDWSSLSYFGCCEELVGVFSTESRCHDSLSVGFAVGRALFPNGPSASPSSSRERFMPAEDPKAWFMAAILLLMREFALQRFKRSF